jgi:Helix-turn-helix domain
MNQRQVSPPYAIGRELRKEGFVMTDKKAHEVWAMYTLKKPTASAVMHFMCSYMQDQNALVISQTTLAKRLGVTSRTIATAIADLAANQWIQIVRIGKGKECAYVVNDRVAWDKSRGTLHLSLFTANVVADAGDQDQDKLEGLPLKRIPVLFPGELQLPTGAGLEPPAQPSLDGLEPDLPNLLKQNHD